MKKLILIAAIALSGLSAKAQGTTQFTVFPYGLENQNGNYLDVAFQSPTEYQLILRSSYLSEIWTSPVMISGIAFRVEEGAANYNTTIPQIEVQLSTTSVQPEAMRPFWQLNSGPDVQVVYNSQNVTLSSPGGAGPNPFGLELRFSDPFRYDPQQGNLAIFLGTDGTGTFLGRRRTDAQSFGQPIELSPAAIFGGVYQTPNASSPIMRFEWTAIPEPNCVVLCWFGILILTGRSLFQSRRSGCPRPRNLGSIFTPTCK